MFIDISEVTKQCYTNHATSKLKSFNLNSSTPIQHSNCSIRRNQSSACASVLYTKVLPWFFFAFLCKLLIWSGYCSTNKEQKMTLSLM